jgi:hypothetical protein
MSRSGPDGRGIDPKRRPELGSSREKAQAKGKQRSRKVAEAT